MDARSVGRAAFDLPVGTLTFLLSDVAGSALLWDSDPEAMSSAIGRYNELLDAGVALHGAAGNWWGARIVSIPTDPSTGFPLPSGDLSDGGTKDGPNVGMTDFATGWDDGTLMHGRPGSVTFAPDGRMFVANDTNGSIIWIAAM